MLLEASKLERLYFSDAFQSLLRREKRFNIFRLLGVAHKELPHSNVLAHILDPTADHGLGHRALNTFLHMLPGLPVESGTLPGPGLSDVLSWSDSETQVYRERDNLDVLVVLSKQKTVICIENKLWAGEGADQISRYQELLNERFATHRIIIVFLTPQGQPPSTHRSSKTTSVLIASYTDVLSLVEQLVPIAAGRVQFFLDELAAHLKEDIVGDADLRRLSYEIWRKHGEAIRLLQKNRPGLETNDFSRKFIAAIMERLGAGQLSVSSGLEISLYPSRGERKEQIFVRRKAWPSEAYLVLYLAEDNLDMKLLGAVQKGRRAKYEPRFTEIFHSSIREVDAGWTWWAFTSDGVHIVSNNDMFGPETLEAAVTEFMTIFYTLDSKLVDVASRLGEQGDPATPGTSA